MNIAVILAGGTGKRLGRDIPKQFVDVLGKPLIVHALEIYETSPYIDAIEVVCVPEYVEEVVGYADSYSITKLKWVVEGGDSCQASTWKGISHLEGVCAEDDTLLFGMSTSVFVDDAIIKDSLEVCARHGNAFAAMQCIYNLATTEDGLTATSLQRKEVHKNLNLPWTAPFGTLLRLFKRAYAMGIETDPAAYMPTLFLAMGETLFLSKDTTKNLIHVTTPEDLQIVEACLRFDSQVRKGDQIWNT